jgi:hypothetical protein
MIALRHAWRRRAAVARDNRDRSKIEILQSAIGDWLEQIKDLDELEHPDSRWHPDDLRLALERNLFDLRSEQERLRGPLLVVVE